MFMCIRILIILKLVTAVHYDEGPQCHMAFSCKPNEDCNKCNVTELNSKISIKETGIPGHYKTQMLENVGCRIEILNVFINRYEVNESLCNSEVFGLLDRKLHSQEMYSCDDEAEIISSADIHNQIHPKINLVHYVDMVYKGCYTLEYVITFNKSKTTRVTQVVYLNNNLTKEYFDDQIKDVKFVTDIIGPSNPVTLKIPYRFSKDNFAVKLNNSTYETDITNNSVLKYINAGSELICHMPDNILPGEYGLTFTTITAWCNGKIFDKRCTKYFNFTIVERQTEDDHALPYKSTEPFLTNIMWLIPVMIAVILFCHFGKKSRELIHNLCKRNKQFIPKNPLNVQKAQEREELKAIVLVYARDCEPFMNAVVQLRKLLEERCMVKVYDIFDTHLFNAEIASAPNEWAGCMLAAPGVKFVLLKTRCGELLYDSIIVNNYDNKLQLEKPLLPTHTRYRKPLYADTYVHTLFRLVKDDAILPGSYTKYFVVEIQNFSGDRQFVYVNPYRRYDLPGMAHHLVSELLNSSQLYETGLAEQRLQEAIESLRAYVYQHPDYMMELLCTQ